MGRSRIRLKCIYSDSDSDPAVLHISIILSPLSNGVFLLFQVDEEAEDQPTVEADQPDDVDQDRFMNDALPKAYVRFQAGWSEQVSQHWSKKRAKLLAKVLAKC